MKYPIHKIISGGQTGVDRAALDFGLHNDIPVGGWCPKGRKAEDGTIALRYPLIESPSIKYSQRTILNVMNSDGTLIIYFQTLYAGTSFTIYCAKENNKPCFVYDLSNVAQYISLTNEQVSE